MMDHFSVWLAQNGLTELFTTPAGDSMYINHKKQFGVIRKMGEYAAQSFYLDDIIECKTYDDEYMIAEWGIGMPWKLYERSTRYTTNQVYMNIRFKNSTVLKLQLFRGTNGNIKRDTNQHIDLLNYACRITQAVISIIPRQG